MGYTSLSIDPARRPAGGDWQLAIGD